MHFLILVFVVIGSALGVVYEKYLSRQLFTKIQQLEKRLDNYEIEWGQLQLEQTTWVTHGRVEKSARNDLGLVLPDRKSIVYLKP